MGQGADIFHWSWYQDLEATTALFLLKSIDLLKARKRGEIYTLRYLRYTIRETEGEMAILVRRQLETRWSGRTPIMNREARN